MSITPLELLVFLELLAGILLEVIAIRQAYKLLDRMVTFTKSLRTLNTLNNKTFIHTQRRIDQ